eukprot:gene26916-35311_t
MSSTTEFLKWVRLLIGSGSLLIPTSLPHRDTIVEGLFSLSQLLPLVLEESKVEDDATDKTNLILKTVSLTSYAVSNLEIFLESVTFALGANQTRKKLILVLEAIKATCRIIFLFMSKRPL